jgi:hypothetical protein
MPIDEACVYECAEDWFPPFLTAASLTPSHPLRESALRAAEQCVYDSYRETAEATAEGGALNERYEEIAEDVVKVLRGVASWVAGNVEIRRQPQVIYEHGDPRLYCMACDHYHDAAEGCALFDEHPRGFVIDKGRAPDAEIG